MGWVMNDANPCFKEPVFKKSTALLCLFALNLYTFGNVAAQTSEEQVNDIKAQVALLTAQTTALTAQQQLLTAQMMLQVMQQTNQAVIDKGTIDKLKDLVVSQTALDKAKGSAPFAELQGIKEGLTNLSVTGKEGVIAIVNGTQGTLLLRVKKEMLITLENAAQGIIAALPQDTSRYVIASDNDIDSAYKSEIFLERLAGQRRNLEIALGNAKPPETDTQALALPAAVAAIQSVPFLLNVLSDAGKFFRVDRSVAIFDAGAEAQRIIELLVEAKATPSRVTRLDGRTNEILDQARELLKEINALKLLNDQATDYSAKLQNAIDAAGRLPPDKPKPSLPSNEVHASLKGEIASAKAMLDALNPSTAPDVFWAQVAAQVKSVRLKDRGRITITAVAQTVQMLEKRVWRSDRLIGSGEAQVEYRITQADGKYIKSGVQLYTSATRNVFKDEQAEQIKLPSTESMPVKN